MIKHLFRLMMVFGVLFLANSCQNDPDPNIIDSPVVTKSLVKDYNSDIAIQWIHIFTEIETDLQGYRPVAAGRALAYIWMSGYEAALPGMPDNVSNEVNVNGLNVPKIVKSKESYNWELAVNNALATTLVHLMPGASPSQLQRVNNLRSSTNEKYKRVLSEEIYNNSIEWGVQVAQSINAFADTDQEAVKQATEPFPTSFVPVVGDGKWIPTNNTPGLFPYWGKARTFANFGSDLLCKAPPAFSTDPQSAYYRDFLEVNNEVTNTIEEKRWRAEFWSDDFPGVTFGPTSRVFQIARQMIEQDNMNLETTLEFLVKLGIGLNDAGVGAWNSKYYYNVERPANYITKNINKNFKTILGRALDQEDLTPPFPGYPSGHSSFAGAQYSVMKGFFSENYYLVDRCHEGRTDFMGSPRKFSSLSQISEENAFSRIPLGVHPRFDCEVGHNFGIEIGKNVIERYNLRKVKSAISI